MTTPTLRSASVRPGPFVRRGRVAAAATLGATVLVAAAAPASAALRVAPPAVAPGPAATNAPAIPAAPRFDRLDERLARIRSRLAELAEEHHVPGWAVSVVVDGEPVLVLGGGVRDVVDREPVDADTLFAIGSSTKSMTAVLAAMLDAEGVLSLDAKVADRLPEFRFQDPAANEAATIADLMCHRSGVMRTDLLWYGGYADWDDIITAFASTEPVDAFGEGFNYQNVCFAAAGRATARAVNQDWPDFLRARLLRPLGMTRSTPDIDPMWNDPNAAAGYDVDTVGEFHPRDEDGVPVLRWAAPGEVTWDDTDPDRARFWRHRDPRDLSVIAPAGAVNSSARDMARWLAWVLTRGAKPAGGPALPAASFERLWTPANQIAPSIGYGLGFMLREWRGMRMVEHGGNIDGFSSAVSWLPDDGVGVGVFANVSLSTVPALATELILAGLHDPLPADDAADPAEATTPVEVGLDRFAGVYDAAALFGRPVTVAVDEGQLTMDVPGQRVYRLGPADADGFRPFVGFPMITVGFLEHEGGEVYAVALRQSGLRFEWLREAARFPIDEPIATFAPLLGRYDFEEGRPPIRALVKDDRLAMEVPGEMTYSLLPADDDGWRTVREQPLLAARFERDEEDGPVTGLTLRSPGGERTLPRIAEAPGDALPTIEDLVLQVQTAMNRDAWESRLGLRLTGTLVAPNQGLEGTCTLDLSGYDRLHERTDFGRFGWVEVGLFGDRLWSDASFQPFETSEPEAIPAFRQFHPMLHAADWESIYDSFAVIGRRETDDGRRLVLVRVEMEGARPATVEVDEATGLVHRIETTIFSPAAGALPREIRFEDWRPVDGALVPFRIITDDPGAGRVERTYDAFELDPDFGEEIFRKHHPGG